MNTETWISILGLIFFFGVAINHIHITITHRWDKDYPFVIPKIDIKNSVIHEVEPPAPKFPRGV